MFLKMKKQTLKLRHWETLSIRSELINEKNTLTEPNKKLNKKTKPKKNQKNLSEVSRDTQNSDKFITNFKGKMIVLLCLPNKLANTMTKQVPK